MEELIEKIRLRLGKTKLGTSEYRYYHLEDDHFSTFEQKQEFIGWQFSSYLDKQLNDDKWRLVANDKIIFYSIMKAAGLAYPEIYAIYNNEIRPVEGTTALNTQELAWQFLLQQANYPFFVKPVHGTYGRGAFSAITVDKDKCCVTMGNGEARSIQDILEQFKEGWSKGYILQKILEPHPKVHELVGNRLSSLRIVVLLTNEGAKMFRGVWKFPTGTNMSDNFMHGETGNLIANINLKNGLIDAPVTGTGANISTVSQHPDTGMELLGLKVPMWESVCSMCLTAAQLFPGLRMQHWDIALCPDGPVALEVNVEGSVDLHQISGRKGFYDKTLQKLLCSI